MEIKKLYMYINLQSCYLGVVGFFVVCFCFSQVCFFEELSERKLLWKGKKILPSYSSFSNNLLQLFSIATPTLPDSVIAELGAWTESKKNQTKQKTNNNKKNTEDI